MGSGSLTESLQETLAAFDGSGEPRTTPEVAEQLDLGRRSTYARLDRLADQGLLETKKVGANARVWWRTDGPDTAGTEEEFRRLVDAVDEYAIFTLDRDGYVRTWNPGAERIKGFGADEILDEHFSTFYTAEDCADGVPDENLAQAADQGAVEDEGWRVRADGSRFWANVTITAIRGADGSLEGFAKVTRDMTERKRTETERELLLGATRAIAEAETFDDGLETALHTLCEASDWEYAEAWLPTDDGRLRRAEAAYVEDDVADFAAASADVVFDRGEGLPGRVWETEDFEWNPDLSTASSDAFRRRDAALAAGLLSSFGVPIVANDEVVAVLSFLGTAPREANERFVRTVSSVAAELGNLVVRRRLEVQIEQERDLVDQVLETSPVGIMVLDGDGEYTRINDRAKEILEIRDDATESYHPAERTVYDADGDRVPPDDHPASRALETGEPVYDWQARVAVPSGGHRWLSVNAAPICDDDGEVERVVTTGEDITQLKEQAHRLERERDELQAELDEVFERISDGFFAVNDEWELTYLNETTAADLGAPKSELIGEEIWDVFPDLSENEFGQTYREAMRTQESLTVEGEYPAFDGWYEDTVYPSETGLSVYFRDITERKRRERELERYETIVETVHEGIYVVDQDGYFTQVNAEYESITGRAREDLVGAHVSDVVDDDSILREASRLEEELAAGERSTASLEAELTSSDGRTRIGEATFSLMDTEDGYERIGVVRDVTERTERQQELRRYESIVETVGDGIYVLDEDFHFTEVNDAYVEMTGYSRDELLGTHCSIAVSEDVSDESLERIEEIAADGADNATLEADIHRADGTTLRAESRFTPFESDDGALQKIGVVRDVSDRVARERELRRRVTQQEAVSELGQRALEDTDLETLFAEAADLVAATLDTDYCELLEIETEADEFRLREGTGWAEGTVGSTAVSAVGNDSQAAYTVGQGEPVVVADLSTEPRFDRPDLLADHDVRSGVTTTIGPQDDPWGVLGAHDRDPTEFSDDDAAFVQSVANVLASAIERHEHEQALIHQREQLAALNNVNEVLRGIAGDVIEQSTRAEIEATVCERLADASSYQFAWIGEADAATGRVTLRTEAGVEGYLEDVTISIDPADERSQGPTGRAFRTGEIQTTQDIGADARHDPRRDETDAYGGRSSAAIPIVHEDTVYGVLNVYADRPRAFEGQERALLAQLGEIVGHAIGAAERKRALMSDEVIELAFQIQDVFDAYDLPFETDGTITLDHAIPAGDGDFLVHGTATPDAVETVTELVAELPHWESVSIREGREPTAIELRLTDPPVLSVVASHGGRVEQTVIEDGDYRTTVHLAPSIDVRRVIEAIDDAYPGVEMLRRRQISRSDDDPELLTRRIVSELTDQQRAALETAHHAGYFEWPRDLSGEDVAASLDIAPATFHQHLRKAERKVFETVFSDPARAES